MLDDYLRNLAGPPFAAAAKRLSALPISAIGLTISGFAGGLAALGCIAAHHPLVGLAFLVLNQILAVLGRSFAGPAVMGEMRVYLDRVFDLLLRWAMPLAFALADPSRALAGAFLILALASTGTIFLVSDVFMFRRGLTDSASDHITLALVTFLAFALACLVPAWFSVIAYVLGVLCFIAMGTRVTNVVERLK
jgi:hypothetical protein